MRQRNENITQARDNVLTRATGGRRAALCLTLALGVLGVFAGSASAATRTVCASGCDFTTIQAAVSASSLAGGDTVDVQAGTYNEDVVVDRPLTLHGAGAGTTTITGPIGGGGATVQVTATSLTAPAVVIDGFTITRDGNNTTDWDNPGLNSAGVAVQSQTVTAEVKNNSFTGNRTAIDINNSNGNSVHHNSITNNRTGLIFRNQTDNTTLTNNFITGNWTVGVLFLDASGGTNVPIQSATGSTFSGNDISGNWYGQIVDRQSGGSLPVPGLNTKNFSGNWYGTNAPLRTTASSTEPGYAAQIPTVFGGSATPPGGQPDIAGAASSNFDYTPFLWTGTDTDVAIGFQGDFSQLGVTADAAQTQSTGRIQEGIDSATVGGAVHVLAGTYDEHADVNKRLHLTGEGDTTIVDPSTDGPAIAISASGTMADPLSVSQLKTTGATGGGNTGSGMAITAGVSWVTVSDVTSTANSGHGLAVNTSGALAHLTLDTVDFSSNTGTGLRFPTSMDGLDGLTIDDSNFDSNASGMEIYGPSSTAPVTNVAITSSTFSSDTSKGIYAERLSDAVLDDVTVDGSGTSGGFAAGIDINLKKQAFSNIEIKNSDITDSGTGDATNGYGLTIKARDDSPNGPTTLTGVNVHHNTITGNQRGIRLGEPGKNNPGPTGVHFNRNDISGNLSTEGMTNVTTQTGVDAECNWWGSASGPGAGPNPRNSAGPGIDSKPWLRTSTLTGNCPPEAVDDSATTNEDTAVDVPVLTNDHDFENSSLTPTNISDPPNGTATANLDGTIKYTPDANYNGPDSFTYTASDGTEASDPATVSITVNPVNDAPVAVADSASVDEDDVLTVAAPGVLTNDSDIDSATLSAVEVSGPDDGTLDLHGDGSYTYTPDANFFGSDSFEYKANDGALDSNTVTVTITVNSVNDPPVANDDDGGTVIAGHTIDKNAMEGVLSNDTDLANEGQTLSAIKVTEPAHGTVDLNSDGSYSYTADSGYGGPDSFTYKANDGVDDSATKTVSITVNATNSTPIANDDTGSTNEDTPLTVAAPGVLANDPADADGPNPRTADKASEPAHGTAIVNPNGSYTYTPDANYNGLDTFTYTSNDGEDDSNPATVTITVNPVDDSAAAADDSASVGEDSGATGMSVRSNDSDPEGDPFAVTSVTDPPHGTAAITAGGADVRYTPDPDYCNSEPGGTPDTFDYTLTGGDTATVSVIVLCADDAPVARDDAKTLGQGAPATEVDVLANDPDVDGGAKQVVAATQAAHGNVALSPSGLTYRPDSLYCNTQAGGTPDTFTYTLNGGSQATVSVTVTCVNSPAAPGEPPLFASARLTNTTFAVDRSGPAETAVTARAKKGTTFVYSLSEDARVVFKIEQRTTGRRVGTKCQKTTKRNKSRRKCTRYVRIGSFAHAGKQGTNRKSFSGKIGRKVLRPSRYRATLTATDADGNASKVKRLNFRVVAR
jgi:VCBS repeat-containing protein